MIMDIPRRRPRVLLCASGSVATVKLPELAVAISSIAELRVVVTTAADSFLARARDYNADAWSDFESLLQGGGACVSVLRDADEWDTWRVVGDPVVHIQLKDWADVLLIAPLSANTLAKLAHGLSDNLLTSVARAWRITAAKPALVAPAMNTDMWDHPLTSRQLAVLTDELGYRVIDPVEKKLACGVVGKCCILLNPLSMSNDATGKD